MIETVYVIHLARETARESNIRDIKEHIIKLYPNVNFIVYSGIDKNTINFEDYRDLKIFHRMPTHKNESIIRGEIALSLTHLAIFREIVQKKLNNVLVLEDDVILNKDKDLNFVVPENSDLFYLGGHIWKGCLWGCYSILYPKWESTKNILNELLFKFPRRFRAIDSMIKRYIHTKFIINGFFDYRNNLAVDKMIFTNSLLIPDFTKGSILRDIDNI
jgi:hypothetical protein